MSYQSGIDEEGMDLQYDVLQRFAMQAKKEKQDEVKKGDKVKNVFKNASSSSDSSNPSSNQSSTPSHKPKISSRNNQSLHSNSGAGSIVHSSRSSQRRRLVRVRSNENIQA